MGEKKKVRPDFMNDTTLLPVEFGSSLIRFSIDLGSLEEGTDLLGSPVHESGHAWTTSTDKKSSIFQTYSMRKAFYNIIPK